VLLLASLRMGADGLTVALVPLLYQMRRPGHVEIDTTFVAPDRKDALVESRATAVQTKRCWVGVYCAASGVARKRKK
jgi:hypothetical protein